MGTKVSDMQKNVTPGRRKGCPNYPPEFKQQLVAASCEPGISISKLALENGINANLLFKWRQQWREGKLLLPSSESPQLLPVTLDAAAEQPERVFLVILFTSFSGSLVSRISGAVHNAEKQTCIISHNYEL
ncbi:transposase [Escherichia coli]|nr:transposase [Escherichia coli]